MPSLFANIASLITGKKETVAETAKYVSDTPAVTALKNKVYGFVAAIAAEHGINTKNKKGDKFPISDGNEHMGLLTPRDYRNMGDIEVVQVTPANGIRIGLYGQDRNHAEYGAALSKIETAVTKAGMAITDKAGDILKNYGLTANFPKNVTFEKGLEKLAGELEIQAGAMKTKLKVAETVSAMAAQYGIDVENKGGVKYPVNDGLEHVFKMQTPRDYIAKGNVEVVQNDPSRTIAVNLYMINTIGDVPELQDKFKAAMKEAGLEKIKTEFAVDYSHAKVHAQVPQGADMEAIRLKLSEALEKQLGKDEVKTMKVDTDVSVWQSFNSVYRYVADKEYEASKAAGYKGPTFPVTGKVEPGTFSKIYDSTVTSKTAEKAIQQVSAVKAMFEHYKAMDNDEVKGHRSHQEVDDTLAKLGELEQKLSKAFGKEKPGAEAGVTAGVKAGTGHTSQVVR